MQSALRHRERIGELGVVGVESVSATNVAPGTAPINAGFNGDSDTQVVASPVSIDDAKVSDRPAMIATFERDIDAYDRPAGEVTGTVAASWHGRPSALAVIAQQPDWLHVRLALRPNGSTAWVRRSEVTLTTTPYRIEIDVSTKRLRLFERGELTLDAPAGVGTDDTPTVTGEYFVTFFQEAPSPGYGPFVIVTSAHSDTISDWQESGDAVIAIHGPLDTSDEIGATGAKVSNGCIRLHANDLAKLRDAPAGSPVSIVATGSHAA